MRAASPCCPISRAVEAHPCRSRLLPVRQGFLLAGPRGWVRSPVLVSSGSAKASDPNVVNWSTGESQRARALPKTAGELGVPDFRVAKVISPAEVLARLLDLIGALPRNGRNDRRPRQRVLCGTLCFLGPRSRLVPPIRSTSYGPHAGEQATDRRRAQGAPR